jgi:uncharacterized protein (DUF2147 family)
MAALMVTTLCAADSVEGYWKSIDEKTGKVTAAWHIYQENNKLYGVIVTVPNQTDSKIAIACKSAYKDFPVAGDVSKMTVVNTPFIFGLTRKTAGQWENGNIIDPKDGKIYKCKITFHAADNAKFKTDMLEMRGEIGLGIGRSQYWERTNEAEIEAMRMK